jgi:S1-C subfamily serine protease
MKLRRFLSVGLPSLAIAGLVLAACFGPDPGALVADPAREPDPFDLQPEEARLVKVFREVSPSVVFISSSVLVRRGYFSRNVEEMPYGTGSGFVWDKAGHIVTNFHVVKDYVESGGRGITLTVTLDDQSTYKVKRVVGVFMAREIAVLEIDAPPEQLEKLKPIPLGRSKDLQVGQTAIAIGNPFGLDRTLTLGIVSALNREIRALTGRRITGVIQTDAAINPGNSGGPLLNSAGQFIGMNTAILSPSGASAGIGFAIPGDIVRRYVDQIVNKGSLSGPGLGVRPFDDDFAEQVGIKGVLIAEVFPGSSAEKAGLRGTKLYTNREPELGDVIVGIGADRIVDFDALRGALEKREVGETVPLKILREGRELILEVTLQKIDY